MWWWWVCAYVRDRDGGWVGFGSLGVGWTGAPGQTERASSIQQQKNCPPAKGRRRKHCRPRKTSRGAVVGKDKWGGRRRTRESTSTSHAHAGMLTAAGANESASVALPLQFLGPFRPFEESHLVTLLSSYRMHMPPWIASLLMPTWLESLLRFDVWGPAQRRPCSSPRPSSEVQALACLISSSSSDTSRRWHSGTDKRPGIGLIDLALSFPRGGGVLLARGTRKETNSCFCRTCMPEDQRPQTADLFSAGLT